MVEEARKELTLEEETKALLGLIDFQSALDKRLNQLFKAQLICPDEVTVIKENIMQVFLRF